ncbi:MAG: hypothetical protein IJQ15_11320 [Synergistaceae bacterium]|nr:hypothetical protein [Synergistaceae bacterium]
MNESLRDEVICKTPEDTEQWVKDWGERLSKDFSEDMSERVSENSKSIYTVMRETCAILDWLLCEEQYHVHLTIKVRDKLAKLLRMIDGTDEQV